MNKLINLLGEYFFGKESIRFYREQENWEREFRTDSPVFDEYIYSVKEKVRNIIKVKWACNAILLISSSYFSTLGEKNINYLAPIAIAEAIRIINQCIISRDKTRYLFKRNLVESYFSRQDS